jgi:hypothetical protein
MCMVANPCPEPNQIVTIQYKMLYVDNNRFKIKIFSIFNIMSCLFFWGGSLTPLSPLVLRPFQGRQGIRERGYFDRNGALPPKQTFAEGGYFDKNWGSVRTLRQEPELWVCGAKETIHTGMPLYVPTEKGGGKAG